MLHTWGARLLLHDKLFCGSVFTLCMTGDHVIINSKIACLAFCITQSLKQPCSPTAPNLPMTVISWHERVHFFLSKLSLQLRSIVAVRLQLLSPRLLCHSNKDALKSSVLWSSQLTCRRHSTHLHLCKQTMARHACKLRQSDSARPAVQGMLCLQSK